MSSSSASSAATLSLNSLTAGYPSGIKASLPDLSLTSNATLLLRGPSGSGKTTLLHTLAGLKAPVSGSVFVNGHDLYKMSEGARDVFRGRYIGIVFQSLHLVKSLSVLQNVLLASMAAQTSQKADDALSLLETLDIAHLKDRNITDISQGQAQRVAIARALIARPSLILADEPTSSLDDIAAEQTAALLQRLAHDRGSILIVSSHDGRITDKFSQVVTLGETA